MLDKPGWCRPPGKVRRADGDQVRGFRSRPLARLSGWWARRRWPSSAYHRVPDKPASAKRTFDITLQYHRIHTRLLGLAPFAWQRRLVRQFPSQFAPTLGTLTLAHHQHGVDAGLLGALPCRRQWLVRVADRLCRRQVRTRQYRHRRRASLENAQCALQHVKPDRAEFRDIYSSRNTLRGCAAARPEVRVSSQFPVADTMARTEVATGTVERSLALDTVAHPASAAGTALAAGSRVAALSRPAEMPPRRSPPRQSHTRRRALRSLPCHCTGLQ